jgi:uncharacterized delta-60 repeat protein
MKKDVLLIFALLLSILFVIPKFSFAQWGVLDSTFGTGGKDTTAVGSGDDEGHSSALQSDGKIVVAGSTYNGTNKDFALVRYKTNGSRDSTFGTNGIVTTSISASQDIAYSVAIQTDGKIVVAGIRYDGSMYYLVLARYDTNGILDNSFDSDGKVLTYLPADILGQVGLCIQPDGKIVAVAGNGDFIVARFNSDGSYDNTFGNAGVVYSDFGNNEYGKTIAIQSDGKILAAGRSADATYMDDFIVARYLSNGALDNTFGTDGKVKINMGSGHESVTSIAIQNNGNIILAGYTGNPNTDFAMLQLTGTGTLDYNFGTAGKIISDLSSGESDQIHSIAIQTDGKILAAGQRWYGYFALVRYTNSGALDNTFGTNGIVITSFGIGYSYGTSVLIQSDNKIVVTGTKGGSSESDFGLARYSSGILSGIDEQTSENSFSLFPNPATNNFSLQLNPEFKTKNARLEIYNMHGEKVYEQKIEEQITNINLDSSAGIYFVRVIDGLLTLTKKIIKE